MKVKNYQKSSISREILNRFLIHTSNHLSSRMENLEVKRNKFLDLLEMFVEEDWKNI